MLSSSRARRWTGRPNRKPSLLRPFPILGFEELEARHAPAITFTWTGTGGNSNWSTGANWIGGAAPDGMASKVETLVFPAGLAPGATKVAINDLPVDGVYASINFADTGYTLSGNEIILGSTGVPGSGNLVVNSLASKNVLALDMVLGAAKASDQTFTVNSGGDLTITGKVSGTTGSNFVKTGPGTLTLAGDNSNFTGLITVKNAGGILVAANTNALGSTTAPTVVGAGASLQIAPDIGTFNEPLRLNGLGVSNDGALLNQGGNNTWAGTITLDANSALGATSGVLTITGVIDDGGAGWGVFKEGPGEVQFFSPTGNTYRGLTTVDNGILTVGTPKALGDPATGGAGAAANGTVVNETLFGAGQLRLADPLGIGFTVVDEWLTLNGDGVLAGVTLPNANIGALTNTKGDNTWAGPVTLGSPTTTSSVGTIAIGAAANTNLTISGVISSPNEFAAPPPPAAPTHYNLVKLDQGRVIFNNANTYDGTTTVQQGFLNIRDSSALGATGSQKINGTTVLNGATLELEVEIAIPTNPQTDAQGRDLGADSVTNDANRLKITEPLIINGRGVGGVGALRSVSGINVYGVNIQLGTTPPPGNTESAIGVEPDARQGHPSPDSSYFVNDYSLTIGDVTTKIGRIVNPSPPVALGTNAPSFVKRGGGDLILPFDNPYTGTTYVEQGWVTIRDNRSLGADISFLPTDPRVTVGNTAQPPTIVSDGAAVHIFPLNPSIPMSIPENITISGVGPAHPYAFINQKGVLMNLAGNNTWTGDVRLAEPPASASSRCRPPPPS